MTEAAITNILIRSDRDYSETFVFYASKSNQCAGIPEVLTGTNYIAQIRPSLNSDTLTLDLDVDFSEKAIGKITISSPASENSTVEAGTYYWDLLEVNDDGSRNPLIEGTATIRGTVSR